MSLILALMFSQILLTQPASKPEVRISTDSPLHSSPDAGSSLDSFTIWEQIQSLEELIQKRAEKTNQGVSVTAQDPVRCYLIGPGELVILVPVQHVTPNQSFSKYMASDSRGQLVTSPVAIPNLKEQEKRTRKYKEEQQRTLAIKEANFEKFLGEIKGIFSDLKTILARSEEPLNVHIIVEERDRLWMTSSLKGKAQYQRKVVTLEVNNLQAYTGAVDDIQVKRQTKYVKPQYTIPPF